jgi:hypothetical protein
MRVRTSSGGAIASLTGVGVLLIFIIQNTDRVGFQFLFWSFTYMAQRPPAVVAVQHQAHPGRIWRGSNRLAWCGRPRRPSRQGFGLQPLEL